MNDSPPPGPIRGLIFDLDGTLADSRLDFDAMRAEMRLPPRQPILESLAEIDDPERLRECHEILHQHELAGAERATVIDGVPDLLADLVRRGIPRGLVTRNSAPMTRLMLELLDIDVFDPVITRDDGPAKPDPHAILTIAEAWRIPPLELLMVGDFRFDLEAGRAAGSQTALYAPHGHPPFANLADVVFTDFAELQRWLAPRLPAAT